MGRLRIYFKPIWYNIMHHKAYAGFCVFGTMLTFVFITILLQVTYVVRGNTSPALQAERIVGVPYYILDNEKGDFKGRLDRNDIQVLMSQVKGYECYTCSHQESDNIKVNGQFNMNMVNYVDVNYWNVFQYDFVKGHPFTKLEEKERCAVVNESFVKTNFATEEVIGQEMRFQGNTYKIIGVVADVSLFAQEGYYSIWLPAYFDRGLSGNDWVTTFILFPENTDIREAKKRVINAVNYAAKMKNIDVIKSPEHISTVLEERTKFVGGNLWIVSVGGAIFLLLVIPILNIILLSTANTSIQIAEVGLKRALGANKSFVFLEILVENIVLVIMGTILGIILLMPLCRYIDQVFFSDSVTGTLTVWAGIDWVVLIFEVLPLSLLFSCVSGGLPAYWMVRHPIVDMLKGGTE